MKSAYGILTNPSTAQVNGPNCDGCHNEIKDQYYLLILDNKWHLDCLRCASCHVSLQNATSCFSKDGQIYCKNDYYRIFHGGEGGNNQHEHHGRCCTRCQSYIFPGELIMRAKDFVYHVECFRCNVCLEKLHTGDRFGLHDNQLFCDWHHQLWTVGGGGYNNHNTRSYFEEGKPLFRYPGYMEGSYYQEDATAIQVPSLLELYDRQHEYNNNVIHQLSHNNAGVGSKGINETYSLYGMMGVRGMLLPQHGQPSFESTNKPHPYDFNYWGPHPLHYHTTTQQHNVTPATVSEPSLAISFTDDDGDCSNVITDYTVAEVQDTTKSTTNLTKVGLEETELLSCSLTKKEDEVEVNELNGEGNNGVGGGVNKLFRRDKGDKIVTANVKLKSRKVKVVRGEILQNNNGGGGGGGKDNNNNKKDSIQISLPHPKKSSKKKKKTNSSDDKVTEATTTESSFSSKTVLKGAVKSKKEKMVKSSSIIISSCDNKDERKNPNPVNTNNKVMTDEKSLIIIEKPAGTEKYQISSVRDGMISSNDNPNTILLLRTENDEEQNTENGLSKSLNNINIRLNTRSPPTRNNDNNSNPNHNFTQIGDDTNEGGRIILIDSPPVVERAISSHLHSSEPDIIGFKRNDQSVLVVEDDGNCENHSMLSSDLCYLNNPGGPSYHPQLMMMEESIPPLGSCGTIGSLVSYSNSSGGGSSSINNNNIENLPNCPPPHPPFYVLPSDIVGGQQSLPTLLNHQTPISTMSHPNFFSSPPPPMFGSSHHPLHMMVGNNHPNNHHHQHLHSQHLSHLHHHHHHHHHMRNKRLRTSFKHHQLKTMKTYFAMNHNPDAKDLKQLSQKTGLSKRVLQVWFQNARAKYRRSISAKANHNHGSVDTNSNYETEGCLIEEQETDTLNMLLDENEPIEGEHHLSGRSSMLGGGDKVMYHQHHMLEYGCSPTHHTLEPPGMIYGNQSFTTGQKSGGSLTSWNLDSNKALSGNLEKPKYSNPLTPSNPLYLMHGNNNNDRVHAASYVIPTLNNNVLDLKGTNNLRFAGDSNLPVGSLLYAYNNYSHPFHSQYGGSDTPSKIFEYNNQSIFEKGVQQETSSIISETASYNNYKEEANLEQQKFDS